jgi:small ligand-binding sensory domain FIST
MPPKVAGLFDSLGGRRPVFASYINCAGRAAGHAGLGIEDAVIIQREIAGRVPLLGLYTGVEIAPVRGRPQSLDWTGVLTLFSVAP